MEPNEYCILRYSFRNIFGIMDDSPVYTQHNINNQSGNLDTYNQDLRTLLDGLRNQAAAGGSLRKFAEAKSTGINYKTQYALVQCTPDLSQTDCSDCLLSAFGQSSGRRFVALLRQLRQTSGLTSPLQSPIAYTLSGFWP